jgi:hypothetical protein
VEREGCVVWMGLVHVLPFERQNDNKGVAFAFMSSFRTDTSPAPGDQVPLPPHQHINPQLKITTKTQRLSINVEHLLEKKVSLPFLPSQPHPPEHRNRAS